MQSISNWFSKFLRVCCCLKFNLSSSPVFGWFFKKCASTGNRTRIYRVAGDNSTTEPSMLDKLQQFLVHFRHAIYFKLVFQVALCLLKFQFIELSCFCWLFKKCASTGIRTLVYRVAGDKSTTEPSMLDKLQQILVPFIHTIVFTFVFQVALCVSWMFKLSSSPVFVDCSKMCIDREPNPGLSRGRRKFYHWTIDAWQIATITGSFHTCNLFQVVFQVALCLLKVQFIELSCFCWLFKKCASTGKRTVVYRVAGDKSTTEPSMLDKLQQLLVLLIHAIVFTLVFQVALCVSWMFKLSSSPVFVDCSKMCIDRESNPGLSRGRRQFYHWTIDAWQIATITGSFHTCNLFQVVFQVALCLLKVQFIELSCFCWLFKKCASTGKRTVVYRVAGDKSTTEPSMLDKLQQLLVLLIHAIVFTLVFQVALCVSWMFKLSSSPVFVDCSKMCIDRESNPGLSRGRRQFYHWTIDAWQIATITDSFHTCNLFHVGFPSCSVFVESSIYRALPFLFIVQKMCIDWESNPGLSRGRRQFYHWTIDAWQIATITGSFHTCNLFQVGFPGCSVFVESSIYRALLFLLIVQKMCIDRQSNPCLSRGRRQTYHRTIDAWQIATPTGSSYTCNRVHIGFSGCSLCKLNVQIIEFSRFCWLFKNVHRPGIEPGSIAWQATILPLNHRCLTNCNNYWFLSYMQSISCWFSKLLCVCWKFNLPSSSVFVHCSKNVHRLGIEPGSIAWQATILPLNHRCLTNCNNYWFLSYMQSFSSWFSRLLCVCWKFNLSSSPVFVDCSKNVHRPAIEPLSIAWQATNLPPNHRCLTNCNTYWFFLYMQSCSHWFFRLLSV